MRTVEVCVIDPVHGVIRAGATEHKDGDIASFIHSVVEGWFDCVSPFSTDPSTKALDIVGYVHDEGLLLGLQPNAIASALFGRFLVGRCVVVGTLNADGQYDGASHDVPSEALSVLEWLDGAHMMWKANSKEMHVGS